MRTPGGRTIASRTHRVSWRVRRDEYDGEFCDMVSSTLRVQTPGCCTIQCDEYDVDEDTGGEDDCDTTSMIASNT
jgi:hypothetical protein